MNPDDEVRAMTLDDQARKLQQQVKEAYAEIYPKVRAGDYDALPGLEIHHGQSFEFSVMESIVKKLVHEAWCWRIMESLGSEYPVFIITTYNPPKTQEYKYNGQTDHSGY